MSAELHIVGAERLAEVAREIRRAGGPELRKEMLSGFKAAGERLKPIAREAARSRLPHGGGLAEYVARGRLTVKTRTGGAAAGVRLEMNRSKAGGKVNLKGMDEGVVRHPVFGNRNNWAEEAIAPGFWSEAFANNPQIVQETQKEMRKVVERIARRIG